MKWAMSDGFWQIRDLQTGWAYCILEHRTHISEDVPRMCGGKAQSFTS